MHITFQDHFCYAMQEAAKTQMPDGIKLSPGGWCGYTVEDRLNMLVGSS